MLSQDAGFVAAAQTRQVSAPWYKERLLGSVSAGSLFVIVLVRTVQANLSGVHDAYVHTNCLAALANLAPHLRKLHPHAARCMVSLYDLFSRKLLKQSRAEAAAATAAEAAEGVGVPLPPEEESEALQVSADFVRIALEAINLCLSAVRAAGLERSPPFGHSAASAHGGPPPASVTGAHPQRAPRLCAP